MCIQNPCIRRCAILQRFGRFFVYLTDQFFCSLWKKVMFCDFLSKVNKKNLATKKPKSPSGLLGNFASCHAAVYKLHTVLLFLDALSSSRSPVVRPLVR